MVFTLGSFVLVTVAVAFVSWLKTKGTDETSKDGYFLGGRSLSGPVIFGSLMMTNLSAEQLVGCNGQGYAAGMTAMGWETMCPIALTLMALFFIPKYFKLGISTIPEFLESRFDRATRVIVSFIFLVAYIVTMLPLVLYAGSVAMERNQMWGYYGVPVLAIVVMGILAPRMPSFAPKAAIIVHIVCYGLMMNLLPFHFLYFEVL